MSDYQTALDRFARNCDYAITHCEGQIKTFSDKLLADPAHALEWSDQTFTTAAELEVTKKVKQLITETPESDAEANAKRLIRIVRQQARRLANRDPSSTSQPSNIMENRIRCAWFNVLETLEDAFAEK